MFAATKKTRHLRNFQNTSLYEIDTPGILSEFNVVTPTGCGGKYRASVEAAKASANEDVTFIVRFLSMRMIGIINLVGMEATVEM